MPFKKSTFFSMLKAILAISPLLIAWFSIVVLPDILMERRALRPIKLHQAIAEESLQLDWVLEDLIIDSDLQSINLFVSRNKLFVYGALNSREYELWQINQTNGVFFKKATPSNLFLPRSFYDIDIISSDKNYIYIAYSGGGGIKGSSLGAGGVAIYHPLEQKVLWSSRIPSVRKARSFIANENFFILKNRFGEYYIGDVTKQTISGPVEKSMFEGPSAGQDIFLWYSQIDQNVSYQNAELWRENFQYVQQTPIILDNYLVARIRAGDSSGGISIFKRDTGKAIFNVPNEVVSNVITDGRFAYYLARPSNLIQLNLANGEINTMVNFEGGDFQLVDKRGYFVAIDDSRLYAYLGDGRQLFAFILTASANAK